QGRAGHDGREAILLGVRFPTRDGRPLVLSLHVNDWSAPWNTANLTRIGAITLDLQEKGPKGQAKGILDLAVDPAGHGYYAILGDSEGKAHHGALFLWNGSDRGTAAPVSSLAFSPEMKPEGIAFDTIGGREAAVFVDDTGGYYVVW